MDQHVGEEIWCETYYHSKSFKNVNNAGFKILKNSFLLMFFEGGNVFVTLVLKDMHTIFYKVTLNVNTF